MSHAKHSRFSLVRRACVRPNATLPDMEGQYVISRAEDKMSIIGKLFIWCVPGPIAMTVMGSPADRATQRSIHSIVHFGFTCVHNAGVPMPIPRRDLHVNMRGTQAVLRSAIPLLPQSRAISSTGKYVPWMIRMMHTSSSEGRESRSLL
jgi:hypothetical protein